MEMEQEQPQGSRDPRSPPHSPTLVLKDERSSETLKDLSEKGLICRFQGGFCPGSDKFLRWMDKHWYMSNISNIFFCSRGFICILFKENWFRHLVFNGHWTWTQRILYKDQGGHWSCRSKSRVLYMKLWHPEFDPITEKFDRLTVLVRLPNLPISLRNLSALQSIGKHLGTFMKCKSEAYAGQKLNYCYDPKIYVRMDVRNGFPKKLLLTLDGCDWNQSLEYEYEE